MNATLIKLLTVTTLAASLAGCMSPNGRPDNTGTGALVGGATGATIGALADRGNPGAGALIGGVAGLIAGGLVGHSVDQENEARRQYYYAPTTTTYATPPPAPALGIADIKAMSKAGVSDDTIISQIISTHAVYHLDSTAIIDLSNAGVSQRVISNMINTSSTAVSQPPPPPPTQTVVVAAPGPDYVWVDGEWVWNGGAWVWVSGRWVFGPHPHAIWVGARWERGPYGWYRVPGHWR